MKLKDLIEPSEFDRRAKRIKLLGIYDKKNMDVGRRQGTRPMTAVVQNTATGQVTGRRTAYFKTGGGTTALLPKDDPRYS